MAAKPAQRGRPTKYDADIHPNLCKQFLLLDQGLTNKALAYLLDVSESTLDKWIAKYPELRRAINRGKDYADAEVASAMFERAVGTTVRKSKPVVVSGGKNEPASVEVVEFEEEIPADVAAGFKWLALRRKDQWHEKSETLNVNVNVDFRDYVAELRRRYGDEMARGLLQQQGYSPSVFEGEFEVVSDG